LFGYPKQLRLLRPADFERVFSHADFKAANKHLLLLARGSSLPNARIGFVIAKKHVRLAVERNRIKRVIKEYFRTHHKAMQGCDIVVIARSGLDSQTNLALRNCFATCFDRILKQKLAGDPRHE